jgi:peptide deformylase
MTLIIRTEDQPNNGLRDRSIEVPPNDLGSERVLRLVHDLAETMRKENGCGIAAPQVGIHERIIIVDSDNGPRAYVNPEIVSRSFRTRVSEEGCLSVPGVWGMVKRNRSVRVDAFDEEGQKVSVEADGLQSVIFQHEIDHLDGILFTDRVEKFSKPPKHTAL